MEVLAVEVREEDDRAMSVMLLMCVQKMPSFGVGGRSLDSYDMTDD